METLVDQERHERGSNLEYEMRLISSIYKHTFLIL
jgi:hypothetical protein